MKHGPAAGSSYKDSIPVQTCTNLFYIDGTVQSSVDMYVLALPSNPFSSDTLLSC